jgi:hypothetical protein
VRQAELLPCNIVRQLRQLWQLLQVFVEHLLQAQQHHAIGGPWQLNQQHKQTQHATN